MSLKRKIKRKTERRKERVSEKVKQKTQFPRVSVFRSLNQIYVQIIDGGKSLVSASSLGIEKPSGDKKAIAHQVGLELARRAKEKGISRVSFDRGRYLYHGRVKALADGIREGGITI